MKQQNVDAETGEVVSRDNMVRGYEVAKGQYMIVEDEEIEAVQIESTRTIDIDRFVPKMRSMSVISTRRITLPLMARLVRRLSPSFETHREVEYGCARSRGAFLLERGSPASVALSAPASLGTRLLGAHEPRRALRLAVGFCVQSKSSAGHFFSAHQFFFTTRAP
jgi:Ku70/Ku80 beta-barrel domain